MKLKPPEGGPVLLIDDEPAVREVAGRMLDLLGFEVESADNGPEALAALAEDPERYLLVLLDLSMPQMSGEETFAELRKLNARLPVLFSSGYPEDSLVGRAAGDPHVGFIAKPYTLSSLRPKLRELLGDP